MKTKPNKNKNKKRIQQVGQTVCTKFRPLTGLSAYYHAACYNTHTQQNILGISEFKFHAP